jgi:hypothetical protein
VTLDEKIEAIRAWCRTQDAGVRLELDGSVGFGRPCVGVMWGNAYVDTPGSEHNEHPPGVRTGLITEDMRRRIDRMRPPGDPLGDDYIAAYHKHDCLCVLKGDDTPEAFEQAVDGLYRWVMHLAEHDAVVELEEHEFEPYHSPEHKLLHGPTRPVIRFADDAPFIPGHAGATTWPV